MSVHELQPYELDICNKFPNDYVYYDWDGDMRVIKVYKNSNQSETILGSGFDEAGAAADAAKKLGIR